MRYHKVGGDMPNYRTGSPVNTTDTLKDGFDRHLCESLDAPEVVPSGGLCRYEWNNHLEPLRMWFEAQIITIRGYQ